MELEPGVEAKMGMGMEVEVEVKMEKMKMYVKDYFRKLKEGLDQIDLESLGEIIEILLQARERGKQIFIFGNGGSAATASHFANDLNKLASTGKAKKFKAIALTDNVPLMTAWGNDAEYAEIFAQQLDNLLNEGDIVIGISGSGNSENVIRALELACRKGAITIGLLGFDGGRMKEIVDHYIWFKEAHYGRVEDAHLILEHLISHFLRDESSSEKSS